MFYKRISDLHPLGKPHGNPPDWNDIDPMPVSQGGYYNDIEDHPSRINFPNITETYKIPASSSWTLISDLVTAFGEKKWWDDANEETDFNYTTVTSHPEDDPNPGDVTDLSSEYYAKALWFEVAVQKDKDNKPTSKIDKTKKYQSKRLNAYTMMMNLDEISANVISANYMDVTNFHCSKLDADIIVAKKITTDRLYAKYAYIKSLLANSITADAISSSIGIINNISGDNLLYKNGKFTNISTTNITATGIADLSAAAAYWADVAEIYTADNEYLYGTLVKFGGEKEITIADDRANAVVSEKPAITLNSGNKEENALPIVLTGRSKVRTIHPVKKFDKIYLSEIPGVGAISSYKISSATSPIGIALEAKPYDEEGLVECILQGNFE